MAADQTNAQPVKTSSRPKFKLGAFREIAIESRKMKVGVDLDLEAGSYDVSAHPYMDEAAPDVISVAEGDTVYVPHPLMLSDDAQQRFEDFQKDRDLDQVAYKDPDTGEDKTKAADPPTVHSRPAPSTTYRMAVAIIGEPELWRLLAGGGHSNDIALAWQYLTADQAESLSDPKVRTQRP